ncbi:MAG: sensor histidine kinase [Deltaproteobacteria bacterium]|nr:sensor histidine kinase [Deltaproteobacteria bacterium]
MTTLELKRWFRARMVPVVAFTAVTVALSAPLVHCARARADAVRLAREEAARAGEALRSEMQVRPGLWRYGAAKLTERLAESGLSRTALVVLDGDGRRAKVDSAALPPPRWALWGRAEVREGGALLGTVYVAEDGWPLVATALELLAGFSLLGLFLGAVLLGVPLRALGEAEGRIRRLLGRLALTLQEEDRRRIARDLHDGVGQALTAARLELQALRARAGLDASEVARITARLDEALEEVRRSTAQLAPAALAELGLRRALERHCATVADASGLVVTLSWDESVPGLSAEAETACYRVVQEALANAVRHANARAVRVVLRARPGGGLLLQVEDDGTGQLPDAPVGRGLEGIRERARLLGGEACVGPAPAGGLRVEVTLP